MNVPAIAASELMVTTALSVIFSVRVSVTLAASLYVPALTITWPLVVTAAKAAVIVVKALTPKMAGSVAVPKSASAMRVPGVSEFHSVSSTYATVGVLASTRTTSLPSPPL